jgi:hypothetical protein
MKNRLPVIIAVLLFLAAGLSLVLKSRPVAPGDQTKAPILRLIPKYHQETFSLSIEPAKGAARLSAFAILVKIKSERDLTSAAAVTLTPDFLNSAWSFPFNSATAVSAKELDIKIAGYYVSTNKFHLSAETPLFSLPLPAEGPIQVSIDNEVTKFYGGEIPYRLANIDKTITLATD